MKNATNQSFRLWSPFFFVLCFVCFLDQFNRYAKTFSKYLFVIYTQRRKYLSCLCSLPVKIMQSCELYEQQLKATKGGAFTVAVAGLLLVQSDSPPPPPPLPHISHRIPFTTCHSGDAAMEMFWKSACYKPLKNNNWERERRRDAQRAREGRWKQKVRDRNGEWQAETQKHMVCLKSGCLRGLLERTETY